MFKTALQKVSNHTSLRNIPSGAGAALHALLAVAMAFLVAGVNYFYGPLVVAVLIGVSILLVCLTMPLLGFYVVIVISFFAFYPERLIGVALPISTGIELLILALFLAVSFGRKDKSNHPAFYKSPSSIALFIFFLVILVEAFNKNMYSVAGWVFYVRRYLLFVLIYYIAYRLLDDLNKVKFFIKFLVIISLLNAFYTCKQQWLGFAGFEYNWLMADPHQVALYWQGGSFRKFSVLSDPAANGLLMAGMFLFTLILALNEEIKKRKYFLFFAAAVMLLAMVYTGTRTANVMLACGVALFVIMTINSRQTLVFFVLFLAFGTVILFAPIDNDNLDRIRSSFKGSQEESLNVRNVNRKSIQPYIYAHPFGGGLATSSQEGMAYNPGHPLAGFPPDSGFLKMAIETGVVGFSFAMIYYFLILLHGIHAYFQIHDKKLKTYVLAITVFIFSYTVAQYSQVSVGQVPGIFFFFPGMALFTRMVLIDKQHSITELNKEV